jgi:Ca2+-transporting ATPase
MKQQEAPPRSDLAQVPWHALREEEALQRLGAGPDGLSEAEVRERLEAFGRNALEAEEGVRPLGLLLKQLQSPLIYLLAAAAAVSAATGHYADAGVIVVVIALNSLLGFFQEYRAERALESLRRMTTPHARLRREGEVRVAAAAEVVPGDILLLETGDTVAADCRLLAAEDLEIDESVLTGESEPVAKETGPLAEETPLADRRNMAWMSTAVTGGRGRAVVTGTGMQTELGRIAGAVRTVRREETPLQRRMGRLGLLLGIAGVAFAGLVFLLGLLRRYEILEMVLFAVAVAVSAIPEGLPAVISVTLALGVQRMAARNAIIRRLPAVETLGSTTVICSDKTGTITRNEMTVTRMWAGGTAWTVSGAGYGLEGAVQPEEGAGQPDREALRLLAGAGRVANNAHLIRRDGQVHLDGSPTERALLVAAHKVDTHLAGEGGRPGPDDETGAGSRVGGWRRVAEIPFSSRWKYMAVLVEPDGPDEGPAGRRRTFVKGAPERVLSFCTHALEGGRRVELDEERRARVLQKNEQFAGQALRVLAAAYREEDAGVDGLEPQNVERGLTFVGLWGLLDPPREEAIQAIREAQEAGIHVVMITGDHAATATAIARRTGIAPGEARAVTGSELDSMDGEAIARAAYQAAVFARVTPGHKLKILEALKGKREVVAMTGDGVNDAPALKGADIGVSMGKSGTEVAKGAADMILADDNFATIVHAVEEGRVIFNNIQRVIFFLLATNFGEILTLTSTLVLGLPLPLTAVMILWINLITDGVCTVPLGMEPSHEDVLKQPPRPPGAPVLDPAEVGRLLLTSMVMAAGTVLLFHLELGAGSPAHARSIAFTTLAAFQWFQAFNARSRTRSIFAVGLGGNPWLLLGVGAAALLQILALYTGLGNRIFGTVPLSLADWAILLAVAASVLVLDESRKLLGALRRRRRPAAGA